MWPLQLDEYHGEQQCCCSPRDGAAAIHTLEPLERRLRLWSLHPKHLDPKGLVALWREGLLAQKVLAGQTRGYWAHPQILRFREHPEPADAIGCYLRAVQEEATRRGYTFDRSRIERAVDAAPIPVTRGQLRFELEWLRQKLERRDRSAFSTLASVEFPACHPLFVVVEGDVESWERRATHS